MNILKMHTPRHCEPKGRSNPRFKFKIASSHLAVLFAMTILLTVFYGCNRSLTQNISQKTIYQCSMHPAVTSDKPGDCPICGMRLTRVEHENSGKTSGKGGIIFYRHPMRPDVTSPVPAKDEMGMDYIPVYESEIPEDSGIAGRAVVSIDPERQQQIGVKITEVKKIPLEMKVRALGRVAYDPDLYNTIGEYREAVTEYLKTKTSANSTVRERAESVMKLAEIKLRLAGISSDQMENLKNAGQNTQRLVMLTQSAQNLVLPAGKVWVYADLYEHESDLAVSGQKASVSSSALPGKFFDGEVKTVDLVPNAPVRTMRVRFEIDDPEDLLRAGMSVDVVLQVKMGEPLAVPHEAVLNTGETTLVFVARGNGKFEPREIVIGHEAGGFYEVVKGLTAGEEVVSSANFLIDSESRIRSALQNFGSAEKESGTEQEIASGEHHHG